jgi:hypothetical protein
VWNQYFDYRSQYRSHLEPGIVAQRCVRIAFVGSSLLRLHVLVAQRVVFKSGVRVINVGVGSRL